MESHYGILWWPIPISLWKAKKNRFWPRSFSDFDDFILPRNKFYDFINCAFFLTDLNTLVDKKFLPYSIITLYIIFMGINFYGYTIKNGTKKIIRRNKTIDVKMKWYSRLYLFTSIWFPLVLIYFFNEIYWS